jgi:hypothetical protein
MPRLDKIQVEKLKLDLSNYRTIQQKTEVDAISAMIAISPDRFWSLMENIIDDGYYPTENIIVLETKKTFVVKEGNRRIASLKVIFRLIKNIEVPENIKNKLDKLNKDWKNNNGVIPCAIYQENEIDTTMKIVSLIHAKGEKAGRDNWTSVAKARFNRDEKKQKELSLDLLEKYLKNGKNLSSNQMESWSGDYPITVLDELLPKLYPLLGFSSSDNLLGEYPSKKRVTIEKILYDIGIEKLGFKQIRNRDWGIVYGFTENTGTSSKGKRTSQVEHQNQDTQNTTGKPKENPVATSLTDARSIRKKLKEFKPRGAGREKVVTLLDEMRSLKVDRHPHSFCFLLRSLFEISAKVYCEDHKADGLKTTKSDGTDRILVDILRDIVNYMTKNKGDKEKIKYLHGAIIEISKPEGVLSVTSLNQLIHNPKFSIQPNDIYILFGNVFPLLEEMNK